MKIRSTEIAGVIVVESEPFVDHRGSFTRLFCERELAQVLGHRHIVQINQSRTLAAGAIRGLHYQHPPHAEMKLVRCLKGRVWDVAVDLRRGSPTFLQWHAEELTPNNQRLLVVPEGCAHGFQVLEQESELLYLHTNFFERNAEGRARYDEPRIAITWPLPATDLSARDLGQPLLTQDFLGIQA